MIEFLKTVGGKTQKYWASPCDGSPKPAAEIGKPGDTEIDEDDVYPAEFLPVGDPRSGSE